MTIESTNVQLPLQPPLLIADVSGSTSWDEWLLVFLCGVAVGIIGGL